MRFENRNYAFTNAFVDELARSGLSDVCIAPGSRSSPLTISFAHHPKIKTWMHLDERSAGFFALGMTRALGKPVALVCTSGTAAANFYPAIIEARYGLVPLLVLTSDRPPELVDWGAPQTIDQIKLYGAHAKWSVTMPPPEGTTNLMAFVRSMACRAFITAGAAPAGPVHVNFPFRDPLEPIVIPDDFPIGEQTASNEAWDGRVDGHPYIEASIPDSSARPEDLERLGKEIADSQRGIIVCGSQPDPALVEPIVTMARQLNYPILADPLSQIRCGAHDRSLVIDSFDAFLRDPTVSGHLVPDIVLRFGGVPTSKPLTQYLEQHHRARHILVGGNSNWNDPSHITSEVVHSDPILFCKGLNSTLKNKANSLSNWQVEWQAIAGAAKMAMNKKLAKFEQVFEGRVFSELSQCLQGDEILMAGNSMPVRDMDTFFPSTEKSIHFLANRGVNGIDGVVSTALGVSAVAYRKLVLVLGDISFYHDLNGLLAAKSHSLSATIIVINNNGGGIFSFLPQANYEEVFEQYFGTPHGLTFRAAAELYGLGYHSVQDWMQFRTAFETSMDSPETNIIEIPGDRVSNVAFHREIWPAVAEAARSAIVGR